LTTTATAAAGNGNRPPERTGRASGVLLNDRYVVRQALKHSNKGGVYLAEDRVTGVTAVIKEARVHVEAWGRGGDIADVMRHEARLLEAVAHLGLTPRILELFEQQGHLFLVLERVDGDVLRDYVAGRHEETGQGLSSLELTSMIRQLAEMMDALHGAGVLLRDFTPNNLMVLPSGDLRLIDLELAHLLSDGPPLSWGAATPGFASPEQLAARPSTFSDDYYALGATIAYMATASVPYLLPGLPGRWRTWDAGSPARSIPAVSACGPRPVWGRQTTPSTSSPVPAGWVCSSAGHSRPEAIRRSGTSWPPRPGGCPPWSRQSRTGLQVCTSGSRARHGFSARPPDVSTIPLSPSRRPPLRSRCQRPRSSRIS